MEHARRGENGFHIDGTACVPRAERGVELPEAWGGDRGVGMHRNTPDLSTGRNCRAQMLWGLETQKP